MERHRQCLHKGERAKLEKETLVVFYMKAREPRSLKGDSVMRVSYHRICGVFNLEVLLNLQGGSGPRCLDPEESHPPQNQIQETDVRNRIPGTNCTEIAVSCIRFRGVKACP
eukprot:1104534-Rhodomonas_salina.1